MVMMRNLLANRRASEANCGEDQMVKPREVPGQFRKTKFCRFFESGSCRYETGCTFAHTPEELEDLPDLKKTSICKSWQSGCCKLSADECTYAHGKEDLRRAPFSQKKAKHGKKAASYKETHDGSDDNSTSCGDSQGYQIPFMHTDSRGSTASLSSQPFIAQDDTNLAWPLLWDPLGSSAAERDFGCLELSLGWGQTVFKGQGRRAKKSMKYRQEAAETDMDMFQSCPLPVLLDVMSQQQQNYDCNSSSSGAAVLTPPMSPYAESVILTPVIGYTDPNMDIEEMLKNAMPEHYED